MDPVGQLYWYPKGYQKVEQSQHIWYNKAYALLYQKVEQSQLYWCPKGHQKVEKKDILKIYNKSRITGANQKKNSSDSM